MTGGFPYTGIFYGITPIWASEIEPWPIKVTEKHFPDIKHLGDITQINGAEIEPVDVITFGSPCTKLSVAGRHDGFDITFECQGTKDEPHKIYTNNIRATDKYQYIYKDTCPICGEEILRTNESALFFHAVRIIRQMRTATGGGYPRFAVWENVPGAFSSNKGEDIKAVLDELEGLGFIIDMNVLDAQFMGVPQRRRRIYALCTSADFTRQMTTPISWSIITQLLTEILLCILSDQLNLYEKELKNSVWKQKKLTADGLQRKMKLFSIETRESFEMLLNNWIETCQIHLSEPYYSESHSEKLDTTIKAATNKNEFLTEMELEKLFGSISRSWKELLDVLYYQGNSCITLTVISETTNQIICGCANLLENMALLIGLLKNYSQNLYETELYISTARKVCINYARERQTGITLFSGMEWVQCWDDYIRLYTETTEQLERYFAGQCASEILFIEEGLRGHFAESREAREETAADVGNGIKGTDYLTGWDCQEKRVFSDKGVAPTISGSDGGGGRTGVGYVALTIGFDNQTGQSEGIEVSPAVRSESHGSLPCVATRGIIPFDTTQITSPQNGNNPKPNDPCHSLVGYGEYAADKIASPIRSSGGDCGGGSDVLVTKLYDMSHGDEVMRPVKEGIAPTLNSRMGTGGNQVPVMMQHYAVRRLTPLECLRLQGFPDYWLDIEGMSDTQKYKAVGNSVAIPCVKFVLGGIARVLGGEKE